MKPQASPPQPLMGQFVALFEQLVKVAGEPKRLAAFYGQSQEIQAAAHGLDAFLLLSDFERAIFHRPKKYVVQSPAGFEAAWRDYKTRWAPVLAGLTLRELGLDLADEAVLDAPAKQPEPEPPDPEWEAAFNPIYHDGGAALTLGFDYLEHQLGFHDDDAGDETIANMCRISLGSKDYLEATIGIDLGGVFRRWRNVPQIFMPAHVSNRHGLTEKGSLYDLLDDAVRAYVAGAPAAAIATCRAALEMVLKQHYGLPKEGDLDRLIVLASERYRFVDRDRIDKLRRRANKVLHDYTRAPKLTEADERTILEFLKTLRFLIQRAPA